MALDNPIWPVVAAGGALALPPVRRRLFAVARATGRGAVMIVGATTVGVVDIVSAAVRGEVPRVPGTVRAEKAS